MKWNDARVWCKLPLLMYVQFGLIIFSGCKTKYVPMEKVVSQESLRCDTLHKRDSIYIRDSIFTLQKGDTIFKDRWHREIVLKEVYKNKTDSFIKRDSIPVPYPVEKELSKWEKFQLKYAAWSMGATCVLLIMLSIIIYRKIRKCKMSR